MENFDENNNFDDMNEVMTYYENYCFETKQKEIEEIKTAINKKEKVELDTKIIEEAKEMNLKYPLILYFYQKENNSESRPKTEEELKNQMTSYNFVERGIKDKRISKKDDLESLAYMMIFFIKGELPWQNIKAKSRKEKYTKIYQKKKNTVNSELCNFLPDEIKSFVNYILNLNQKQNPDYEKLFTRKHSWSK